MEEEGLIGRLKLVDKTLLLGLSGGRVVETRVAGFKEARMLRLASRSLD